MGPLVYALVTQQNQVRGIYSSKEKLRDGVDYWSKKIPDQTLSYEEWMLDYHPEPLTWEWCYISHDATREDLQRGGGFVPSQTWWGKNLVGVEWTSFEEAELATNGI